MRKFRNTKGFTLIELMIVVVIIGILAALAIPRFGQATARAKEKEADGILKAYYTTQSAYFAKHGAYAANATDLNNEVGWAAPTGLKNYTMFTVAATPAMTMTKSGNGYCDRQIDINGNLSSLNCN